jgi:FAD/FMN-containing dehydrogenase
VRCGGHNYAGFSTTSGLLIDVTWLLAPAPTVTSPVFGSKVIALIGFTSMSRPLVVSTTSGLLIDVKPMSAITFDPKTGLVTVGAGASNR